jgi:hypothetical protein
MGKGLASIWPMARRRQGSVVGRVFLSPGAPADKPWMWTLAYGQHEDRSPTHGYEATRQAAMAAFAKKLAAAIGPPHCRP